MSNVDAVPAEFDRRAEIGKEAEGDRRSGDRLGTWGLAGFGLWAVLHVVGSLLVDGL